MKHSDFFSKFYMGRNSGGILGYRSQEKIPEFFMKAALPEECHDRLPTSNSAYAKWLKGLRNPENSLWGLVASNFTEEKFVEIVSKGLNDSVLGGVMESFGIELQGKDPDKRLFALALAKQFQAIAQGNGEAPDDVAKNHYQPEDHITSFPEYASRTKTKYEKIIIPFSDGEEHFLKDIYVCNSLSSRSGATRNRHTRTKERAIENATLDSIAGYSKKVILVANGGMGKSVMLQHLFLTSIQEHKNTGVLPIMVRLRDFSENHDLFHNHIVKAATLYDENLTSEKVKNLMLSGKCQILLDGADEIDPSDMKSFQRQIVELTDRYPHNQYLVSSRESDVINGIEGFAKLFLRPFTKEQSIALVEKLLADKEGTDINTEIRDLVDGEYLQKHRVFAANPMLLTFVVMNHLIAENFQAGKRLFYGTVYNAIVYDHDERKVGYSRIFRSARDAEEFTKVFREFCSVTYLKHQVEFDRGNFEGYFNGLASKDTLENPRKMTCNNFIHDACSTACMMYEENTQILYIDPGFQEYLFAQYYFFAQPEKLESLGRSLWSTAAADFDGTDAFEMLHEFSQEKFERTLLLPFLDTIFAGKQDHDSFLLFLQHGYKKVEYQVIDQDTVELVSKKNNAEWLSPNAIIVEPATIIYLVLLRLLNISGHFCVRQANDSLDYHEHITVAILGVHHVDTATENNKIIPSRLPDQEFRRYSEIPEEEVMAENYIHDNNQIIRFGKEYQIDFKAVLESPEKYDALISTLKTPEIGLSEIYAQIKDFYCELQAKYTD